MKSFFVQIQCLISTSVQQGQTASIFVCLWLIYVHLYFPMYVFIFVLVYELITKLLHVRMIVVYLYPLNEANRWSKDLRIGRWLVQINSDSVQYSRITRNQRTKRKVKSRESTKEKKQKRILPARGCRFWENENSEIHVEWMSAGFQFSNVNLVLLNLWNLDALEIHGIHEGCHLKRGERDRRKSMKFIRRRNVKLKMEWCKTF